MYHYTRSICYSYIARVQLLIMQSVVIIAISYKNTENWEDRIYMLPADIDEKIRFVFTMSPLMTKVATESDFIQCDITYD